MAKERDPHEFIFEIDLAIRTQVIQKLEASPELPLSETVAPALKGVYVLYWKRKLVYAGKALQVTLRRRLGEHARKIASRSGILLSQMSCRFLTTESDWFVRAAEDALIRATTRFGTGAALVAMSQGAGDQV
jgi:hypothetical protein